MVMWPQAPLFDPKATHGGAPVATSPSPYSSSSSQRICCGRARGRPRNGCDAALDLAPIESTDTLDRASSSVKPRGAPVRRATGNVVVDDIVEVEMPDDARLIAVARRFCGGPALASVVVCDGGGDSCRARATSDTVLSPSSLSMSWSLSLSATRCRLRL